MKKSVKISKKTGIALFVTAAVIMALLIVFHKNPGPAVDQSQELAKKIISCVVIAAACFAFIHWYDKFTGLPVELSIYEILTYEAQRTQILVVALFALKGLATL